jgi:fucose 4-O-acetylase-like acetyltransferase
MTLTTEASAKTRDLSLDVAKGLGIILVVVGHAWRGLETAGMVGDPALFHLVDSLIYNFHMPLFFLLSGMTFEAWALKRPLPEAAISRVTRLLWPLVLWTYIFYGARLAAGDAANSQVHGWQSLLFFPLPPRDHFWFLWALFLQHLACLALLRLVGRPLGPAIWGALALAVVVGSSITPVGLNAWTFGAATYAGAFLTGLALGPKGLPARGMTAFAVACGVFLGVEAASFHLPQSLLVSQLVGIVLALAFLALVRILCTSGLKPALRLLAWLGVSSMGIYLAHTIFSAGTRAVLARTTTDLSLHMIFGTLAGLIGPLILYALIRRFGRPQWIGF